MKEQAEQTGNEGVEQAADEQAEQTANVQVEEAVEAESAQQSDAQDKQKKSPWLRRVLTVVVIGGVFWTIGYLAGPQAASSASLEQAQQSLQDVHKQLNQALAARSRMEVKAKKLEAELASAAGSATSVDEAVAEHKAKWEAAEQAVADLKAKLAQTQQGEGPLRAQLTSAVEAAAGAKQAAAQAEGRAEKLAVDLASARQDVQKLDQAKRSLQAANAKLRAALKAERTAGVDLKPLMDESAYGDPQARSAWPGEKPVTEKELIARLGPPSVSFASGSQLQMQWGKDHIATTVDGVVTEIDGQAATRAALASVASGAPSAEAAPGRWRFGSEQRLSYTDLVALFGRPEYVAGTGKNFTAWWTIGAWARKASATVAEGVVTKFDGQPVNPAQCCELVRHRAQAYQAAGRAVRIQVQAARELYAHAAKHIAAEIGKEAQQRGRDGVTLKECKLAAFDSVGTWIAPTGAFSGAMTMRAAVVCTWVALDGTQTSQRRYVVVTMVPRTGGMEAKEMTTFAGRD